MAGATSLDAKHLLQPNDQLPILLAHVVSEHLLQHVDAFPRNARHQGICVVKVAPIQPSRLLSLGALDLQGHPIPWMRGVYRLVVFFEACDAAQVDFTLGWHAQRGPDLGYALHHLDAQQDGILLIENAAAQKEKKVHEGHRLEAPEMKTNAKECAYLEI